jgi:diguanylate cyclase (GGDEF)-like protein
MGDEVLQSIAQIMQSSLRHSDLAFRYGGDEFAALFPETSHQAAVHVAQRLEQRFAQHWADRCAAEGKTLVCGLSWGVASFPADAADTVTLVRVADEQLYVCKRAHHERGLREKI